MPAEAWQRLGDYLRETQLLGSIQSTLYWDQNTSMPIAGSTWRGEQLSLIARKLHSRRSSKEYGQILSDAKSEFQQNRDLKGIDCLDESAIQRNFDLLDQDFSRQQRLDPTLVGHLAKAKSEGYNQWQYARSKSDFSSFAPSLKKLIALRQEEAKQLNEPRSCWETLAQPFEPDLTYKRLQELFFPLRQRLPILVENVRSMSPKKRERWDLSIDVQQQFSEQLLNDWGSDPSVSCVAQSPHPFSITLGPNDYRLTTRVVPGQPFSCLLATAHEWGHSLYEQGLPREQHQWFGWPLGNATSMGVHESQSLFWENRVARSKAFSNRWYSRFVAAGAPIRSTEELWRLMNPLTPGLNRVEADELSYGLHILIRTDLEIALLEEGLEVEALPYEWNHRYTELLGATPSNAREGCLQDVHWSEGLFGYFPSYLIGHLISAQLTHSMLKDLGKLGIQGDDPLGAVVSLGKESMLLQWLRENVHVFGRKVNAEQLVKKVTGESLSSSFFLTYLEQKIEELEACT